jgi:hypothetical protein
MNLKSLPARVVGILLTLAALAAVSLSQPPAPLSPVASPVSKGNAYLVGAMAASRSGVKSVLVISRMNPEGTRLLDGGVMVFDGHD